MTSARRMRFVVIGAGAIGTIVATHLAASGHSVTVVARGARLDAVRVHGLVVETPAGVITGSPGSFELADDIAQLAWTTDDIALIAVKTQDVAAVIHALASVAPATMPIACLTNGLAAERLAAESFANVYGVCVMCPGTHLIAEAIQAWGTPVAGSFDVGRHPSGRDAIADTLATAFEASNLWSRSIPDILRWKRAKLLVNLANPIDALCGKTDPQHPLVLATRDEGRACFHAAGFGLASPEESAARHVGFGAGPIAGRTRFGGSTFQSLARGTGIECDYLNGEIVALGQAHGIATPINAGLLREITQAAHDKRPPGSVAIAELAARLLGASLR